jgi:polysaccharide biosynthesis transport protein
VAVKQATIRQATKWLIIRVNELGPELRAAEKRVLEAQQVNREAPRPTSETPSLAELEAALQADRELYTSLLKRSQETLLLEGMQVPDARVVAYASPPSDPSYPVWSLTLALAGLASLLFGAAIALLRERLAGN